KQPTSLMFLSMVFGKSIKRYVENINRCQPLLSIYDDQLLDIIRGIYPLVDKYNTPDEVCATIFRFNGFDVFEQLLTFCFCPIIIPLVHGDYKLDVWFL